MSEVADKGREAWSWVAALLTFVVAYTLFSELLNRRLNEGNPTPTPSVRPTATPQPPPGRPKLGVEVDQLTMDEGLLIEVVYPGSPAAVAGLEPGDLLLEVAGRTLARSSDDDTPRVARLQAAMASVPVGEPIPMTVERSDGTVVELEVRLVEGVTFELDLADELIEAGVAQLLAQRRAGGLWPHYAQNEPRPSVPVSALAAYALRRAGPAYEADWRSAIAAVVSHQRPDGGIADVPQARFHHRVYATSLALLASDDAQVRRDLAAWLAGAQAHESHGLDFYDNRYGGWSYYGDYGRFLRTDVSTARYALQALGDAGLPADHPVWRRTHDFLSQASNQTRITDPQDPDHAREAPLRDGGFAFGPRMSKASGQPVGNRFVVFRSYGSATADGVLSLLALNGLDLRDRAEAALPDYGDPRLLAALRWLANEYDLGANPGFGDRESGWSRGVYFYYLAALAEALHQAGVWRVVTHDRLGHLWAIELVTLLKNAFNRSVEGQPDGTPPGFRNPSGLMHEDSPSLAAAFAVIALSAARDRLRVEAGATLEAKRGPKLLAQELELEPPPREAVGRGRVLFTGAKGCGGCHGPSGQQGPHLAGVGIGARYLGRYGSHADAAARLAAYLRDPQSVSPLLRGDYPAEMRSVTETMNVSDAELEDLVAYLLSLTD